MDSYESKRLALIRIWQILKQHSDTDHRLTQNQIAEYLNSDFGIVIERKAIGRCLSLLKEAGADIESGPTGSYLQGLDFEDSELHLLIDSVLCSRHISAVQAKDLISRLGSLSNDFFKSHVQNIYAVESLDRTDNQDLFYNIEVIDEAVNGKVQVNYEYNKYGLDKKLHKTSTQYVSPYQLLLHNQRYYLMAYSDYWHNMVYHRLDRITNIHKTDKPATRLESIAGFENGIDYKKLTAAMPYMYGDEPEEIEFIADSSIIDQIIDWFGRSIRITPVNDGPKVNVKLKASLLAMEYWAMQYIEYVEIVSPESVRNSIKQRLDKAINKYGS